MRGRALPRGYLAEGAWDPTSFCDPKTRFVAEGRELV